MTEALNLGRTGSSVMYLGGEAIHVCTDNLTYDNMPNLDLRQRKTCVLTRGKNLTINLKALLLSPYLSSISKESPGLNFSLGEKNSVPRRSRVPTCKATCPAASGRRWRQARQKPRPTFGKAGPSLKIPVCR